MASSGSPGAQRSSPSAKRKTFEPGGCARCGSTKSSSFRKCQETGSRLCNSCHCKLYRLKRKAAEMERAGISDGSTDSADRSDTTPHLQRRGSKASAAAAETIVTVQQVGHLAAQLGLTNSLAPPSPPAQQSLTDLQWRTLEEARHAEGQAAVTAILHSAYRAQLATPACRQRVVLGMLPRLDLTGLPGDPPGMCYPVACLVEAVSPAAAAGSGKWAGESQAAELTAHRLDSDTVLLRTTVFGPAGALACWHEGPADITVGTCYSPLSKAPIWCSGPGGFTLEFPGAVCPQLDLFSAIHRQVLALGASVLQQAPILSLSQACLGPASCLGGPVPAAQPLTKRQLARQQAAAEVAAAAAAAAASMHLSMPLPTPVVVQQTAARVHSPQQDLRAQLLSAAQQLSAGQWGGDTAFDADVAAGGGLSGLDNMEMPALSLACSLPSQLFDPTSLDLL